MPAVEHHGLGWDMRAARTVVVAWVLISAGCLLQMASGFQEFSGGSSGEQQDQSKRLQH